MASVLVMMGSESDRATMEKGVEILRERGVEVQVEVSSAHRQPERTAELASGAEAAGHAVVICGAGLSGSTADDVAKEVAIYRAHKAAPIVIATEGSNRFPAALELITVPEAHPAVAFVLATMVGHLFGYHAALAIDVDADPYNRLANLVMQRRARWLLDNRELYFLE